MAGPFRLSNCRSDCDGQKVYVVSTDLTALNGLTINGVVITQGGVVQNTRADDCWAITQETDIPAPYELASYNAFYTDCNYCICGCCTEGIPQASVCADLDLSTVDLTQLGVDNTITVTFIGSTSTLVLALLQGDFTGYTLSQLANAITTEINNGTSGFSATTDGITVTICTPAVLGTSPIGSSVELTFTPQYFLKNEELNLGALNDDMCPGGSPGCLGPITRTSLGYGPTNPQQVAFATSSDLLYVPNLDRISYIYPAPNVPPGGATATSVTLDFTAGVAFPVPTSYTTFIAPCLTTNYFQAGQQFEFIRTVNDTTGRTDCGAPLGTLYANAYRIRFVITAYDPCTGQLDYDFVQWSWQGAGQLPGTPFPALTTGNAGVQPYTPPCCPGCTGLSTGVGTTGGTAIGSGSWTFDASELGWGTLSIYDVDLPTGALSVVTTIEINLGNTYGCVYDSISDSVFIYGQADDLSLNTVLKVDLGIDPFTINGFVTLAGLSSGTIIDLNPVTQVLHAFSGNFFVSKVSKTLQYINTANIGSLSTYHSYNILTGDTWIAGNSSTVTISKITPNLPYLFSTSDTLAPVFTCTPYGQPFTNANFPSTIVDPGLTNAPSVQEIGGIYYCEITNKLFVTRMIRDTIATLGFFTSRGHILQVYDISQGSAAAILGSVVNLPLPTTPAPVYNYLFGNLNFQPATQRLFIPSFNKTLLYIFDPVAETWEPSTVPQPHGLTFFSYTDDSSEPDFFGVHAANNWMSVISVRIGSNLISGIFTGDLNCSPCLPDPDVPFVRSIPDPVKIFYQIKESLCDINVIKRFSNGYWKKVKELRYGITSCCENINLEELWLDQQLTNLSTLLVPDITCTPSPESSACCPWLPTQACQLIPDPTGGTSIIGVAGEDLAFAKLVMLSNDGKFYLNQPGDISTYQRCVGFVSQTAVTNQQVRILISGQLINTGWSLIPGALYYAAIDGGITSAVPVSGISQVIGITLSFNTLLIEIKQPIIL